MTNFPALYFCQSINIVLLITVEPKLAASKNWLLFIPLSVLAAGYCQSDLFLLHQSVYYQAMQQVMWSVLVASHVICTCSKSCDLFLHLFLHRLQVIWLVLLHIFVYYLATQQLAGHMVCLNYSFILSGITANHVISAV